MELVGGAAPVHAGPLIQVDLGAGGLLGLQNGGRVLYGDGLVVHGAVQQEHQGLVHILHGGVDNLVHVGQLLAVGIGLPVVGIADELVVLALDIVLAVLGGQHVGVQGGDTGVVPEVVQGLLAQSAGVGELHAGQLLARGNGAGLIAVQDLLADVLKDVLGGVVPLQVHGQGLDEVVLGGAEGDGKGGVVHLLHHGGIAVGVLVAVAHALAVQLVEADHVVEPYAVLSGEGLAVGPLHPLAEVDGVDGGVVVDLVALGHVGLDLGMGVEAEQALLDGLAGIPVAAAGAALQLAAVDADLQGLARGVDGLDHDVVSSGEAVLHRAIAAQSSNKGGLGITLGCGGLRGIRRGIGGIAGVRVRGGGTGGLGVGGRVVPAAGGQQSDTHNDCKCE